MNAIGFVFCILAILSFGAILSLEKQIGAHRLRSSYVGHIAANRQIVDHMTSEFYAALKQAPALDEAEKKENKKEESQNEESPILPPINPYCAQLNLFPLALRGPKDEPYLYEAAAKLLRVFYGETLFDKKVRAEYKFLDAYLLAVRQQIKTKKISVLETVSFKDPHFQMLYYKMLKGTKKNDGYPSLLDYFKIEPTSSKVCLFHAHPNLLSVFFTSKGAAKLYAAIHAPKAPAMTQEGIERICREVHAPLLDPEVFDLFEINQRCRVSSSKSPFIGEDPETLISIRRVVSIHRPED